MTKKITSASLGALAMAGVALSACSSATASPSAHAAVSHPVAKVAAAHPAAARPAAAHAARTLSPGSRGTDVAAMQRRLASLGYWNGAADGIFGQTTTQAVYAIQKVAGLSADGVVGPKTQAAINRGVRPSARSSASGIEIDTRRNIVIVVAGGKPAVILNTSTASGQQFYFRGRLVRAVTPSGNFHVSSHVNGWQDGVLGRMYKPYYFNGDIAIHGSPVIPSYPASHGCARLSTGAQDMLISKGYLKQGTSMRVYR